MENIDWEMVEAAQRRSRYGTIRPGDMELVERAWKADPKRYRELHARVVEKVTRSVSMGFPSKGGG